MTAEMEAALQAAVIRPCFLLDVFFDSFSLCVWTGSYTYYEGGVYYLGNGWLKSPGSFRENSSDESDGATVILSGVPTSLITLLLQQSVGIVTGRLRFGLLDEAGAVIADPIERYYGFLDVPEYKMDPVRPEIKLQFEDELIDFDGANENRFTRECQKLYFPTDKGFDYVESVQEWSGLWGKPKSDKNKKPIQTRKPSGR